MPAMTEAEVCWFQSMLRAERDYLRLLDLGWTPQQARSVLPNSLKTEIVVTMNLREWRHFLRLRTAPEAHPQMREITVPILERFRAEIPVLFDDIGGDL
jgi:thymidylate synthase (FAD)